MLMATLPPGRHSVSATSEGTAALTTGNLPRPARSANCLSRLRKCHEFETDLDDIAVRQPRTRRSRKINMSREVRACT